MLMRRFTIVCLLVSLFGMSFAMVVVDDNRPMRNWEGGAVALGR